MNFLEKSSNDCFMLPRYLGFEQPGEPKEEGGGKQCGGSSVLHSGLSKE